MTTLIIIIDNNNLSKSININAWIYWNTVILIGNNLNELSIQMT